MVICSQIADTSEKSKQASAEAIEAMGGDSAHYGDDANPKSKGAAENLGEKNLTG